MIAIKQMGQALLPYLNVNRVIAGYTVCQSGTNYIKFTPTNYKLLDRIQKVFMLLDFAIAGTGLLLSLLKFESVQEAFVGSGELGALIVCIAGGAVCLFSYAVVSSVNKYIDAKRDIKHFSKVENKPNLTIKHSRSNQYKFLQIVPLVRIIVTISLTLLGMQTPLLCAISLAALSYSFYKQSCRKWINWTRTFDSIHNYFKTFTLQHYFPLIEIQNQDKLKDPSPICFEGDQEGEDKPEVYFCSKTQHVYHIGCLPGWLASNSDNLPQHLNMKTRTLEIKNGRAKSVTYDIALPESHLVGCPTCRGEAVSQELYFSLQEKSGVYIDAYPAGFSSRGKINIIKTKKN